MERAELLTIAHSKDLNKDLLRHIVIKDRIEAMLEDMNAEPVEMRGELRIGDAKRRRNIFHASEIGRITGKTLDGKYPMGCGRSLYYGYIGAESENSFDPRLRRIFDTGSGIHLQLQFLAYDSMLIILRLRLVWRRYRAAETLSAVACIRRTPHACG